jgi:hypothetical protein
MVIDGTWGLLYGSTSTHRCEPSLADIIQGNILALFASKGTYQPLKKRVSNLL